MSVIIHFCLEIKKNRFKLLSEFNSANNLCLYIYIFLDSFKTFDSLQHFLHSHHMRRYWFYVKNNFWNFHQIFTF